MSFPPPPSPHVRSVQVPSGPPAAIHVKRAPEPPRGGKRWGLRLGLVGGLLAVAAGVGAGLRAHYLPSAYVVPGLVVDGEKLAAGTDATSLRAVVEAHAATLAARKVALAMPGTEATVLEGTLGELGVKVDVDETIALATRVGQTEDVWGRVQTIRQARAGQLDVPLRLHVEREVTFAKLESVKELTDSEAVSARLDLDKHATIPEKDGRYVDQDGTVALLENAAKTPPTDVRHEAARIELPVASFAPRISAAFLKNLDISTVIAEYETSFSRGGEQKRRGKNIDNAAQKLDGLVISPGEMVSLNTVVGERSEANGFAKSWEIFKGEMVEGVGGGTCQVASTFHAAAFFGGLDLLERLPHSRPSAYIPMGLDSTVVYPSVDLKVRNPHPFPVVVHASTGKGDGSKLRIELLGKMRPVEVSFGRELVSTISFKRKVIEEPTLSGKKVLVKQHGIKGFRVKRSRLLKYPDGTKKLEEATDFYPPTVEIYHVPVGFDVSLLPALPALPGGEGEDSEVPSATPASVRAPSPPSSTANATASASDKPADAIEFVDAPGAHAPTAAQRDPSKSVFLKR